MSSQLEETIYQNNIAQEIFVEEDPSQGVDYNAADLLTPTIVPGEVNATEDEHEAQVTTITFDSAVIEKQVRYIDREYFVTKRQRLNNLRKTEIGQEWEILKRDVLKIIDSDLNLQFILNAQNKGIKFLTNNTRQNAQSIKDIGASYAQDVSTDNMTKMNYVLYAWFTDNPLFVNNLENKVMRELNLEYDKKTEDMGCIARLVNMRKNDKVIIYYYSISIVYRHLLSNISFIIKIKNIVGRGKATHQVRISKQRSSVEKKGDAGGSGSGSGGNNKNGSEYDCHSKVDDVNDDIVEVEHVGNGGNKTINSYYPPSSPISPNYSVATTPPSFRCIFASSTDYSNSLQNTYYSF